MKTILIILAVIMFGVLISTSALLRNQFETKVQVVQAAKEQQTQESLDWTFEAARQQKFDQAILERKVLKGMTKHQAKQARGFPEKIWTGRQIPDDTRQAGVVEAWIWEYPTYVVAFDVRDRVMSSTDDDK